MKRIVGVEDFTIFASHGHLQRRLPQRTSEDCVGYGALVGDPSVARYKTTIASDRLVTLVAGELRA